MNLAKTCSVLTAKTCSVDRMDAGVHILLCSKLSFSFLCTHALLVVMHEAPSCERHETSYDVFDDKALSSSVAT